MLDDLQFNKSLTQFTLFRQPCIDTKCDTMHNLLHASYQDSCLHCTCSTSGISSEINFLKYFVNLKCQLFISFRVEINIESM